MALEELIAEDFIPVFTQMCGTAIEKCDPYEIQAFKQERVEVAI